MYMPAPLTYIVFAIIGLAAVGLLVGGVSLLDPAKRLRDPIPAFTMKHLHHPGCPHPGDVVLRVPQLLQHGVGVSP